LRKGLFAVVLVGAAFAGGAAVNDFGRGWIRSLIRGHVPRETIAIAVDEDDDSPPKDGPPADRVAPPVEEIPAAAPPALIPDPPPPPPRRGDPPAPAPLETPTPEPIVPKATPAPDLPGILGPKALRVEAPRDEGPPPLPSPRDVPAPPPPTGTGPPVVAAAKDPDWADAPGSAPAAAVLPRPAGGPAPLDPGLAAATDPGPPAPDGDGRPAGDWAALRRRMRELGVGRYWVEGQPDGPVRFHCIIPLAGTHAVGQHFEAEGEDDLQAAEAALRRVALWRATETP
jgi:hypothetical protein